MSDSNKPFNVYVIELAPNQYQINFDGVILTEVYGSRQEAEDAARNKVLLDGRDTPGQVILG